LPKRDSAGIRNPWAEPLYTFLSPLTGSTIDPLPSLERCNGNAKSTHVYYRLHVNEKAPNWKSGFQLVQAEYMAGQVYEKADYSANWIFLGSDNPELSSGE
jgi:hypothetical protein